VEAISGTCSKCGGDVIQRADDYPDAIRKRLETYERDTQPLLEFTMSVVLVRVNGDQSPTRSPSPSSRDHSAGPGVRRSADELNKMRKAGKVVAEMHEATRAAIRPVSHLELNEVAAEVLTKRGAGRTSLTTTVFPLSSVRVQPT